MDVARIDHCETMGVDETNALLIDGQFCIPIVSHGTFLPDSESDLLNTLNGANYLTADDSGMFVCINNDVKESSEDQSQIIVYTNEHEATIKLEGDNFDSTHFEFVDDNGVPLKTLTLDEALLNVDPFLENTSDLDQINENYELSGFQYVVQLDNLLDVEDTRDSFLCNKLQSQNVHENIPNEQLDFIDFSELTGANRLNPPVCLGNYEGNLKQSSKDSIETADMNQNIRSRNQQNALNNLLNKKLTIGRTTNGQRLVGKIIHVGRKGDVTSNDTKGDAKKSQKMNTVINNDKSTQSTILNENQVELSTLNENQCIDRDTEKNPELPAFSNGVDGNIAEYVSRVLTSLMGMESISKKLIDKNLVINIMEKITNSDKVKMNVLEVQGHLEMRESGIEEYPSRWVFKMNRDNNSEHCIWCPSKNLRNFQETTRLTASIEQANGIIQSAKVNINLHLEQCSICSGEFKTLSNLRTHLKLVHGMQDDHFTCHLCEEPQEKQNVLKERMINKKQMFGCTKCNKQYNTERNLSKHMLASHDSDNWKLACKICGEEYNRMSLWRKHMLTHTTVKPDNEYFSYGDIGYHTRMNDPKSCYVCKVCNRTFTKYSNLQRHSVIHGKKNSISVFSCSMCGCTYNYISSLTRHIVQNHLTVP